MPGRQSGRHDSRLATSVARWTGLTLTIAAVVASVAAAGFYLSRTARGPVPDATAGIAQMAVRITQSMLNERPPDDGHRQNILSRAFRFIGITVTRDSHGTVWMTQDFSN